MLNLFHELWLELAIEGEGGEPAPSSEGVQAVEGQPAAGAEGDGGGEPAVQEEPTYEVDGEKLTLAQIREYRKSGLRQSDYTKKTQEIARLRDEHKEAVELYDYLRNNPDIARQLAELTPEGAELKQAKELANPDSKKIQELEMRFKTQEIDNELKEITSKDNMVTDVELLQIATENKVNVKTAYNLWKGMNMDKILAKKSEELTQQIQKNSLTTKTLVTPGDKPSVISLGLSDEEITMAKNLGMDEAEYAKWKNYKR